GIGAECQVGDVVVSPIVEFDCQKWLKKETFAAQSFSSSAPQKKRFAAARRLFKANPAQLPPDNTRPPKILVSKQLKDAVLTSDFFGFDTSDNHDKLQGLGSVGEMGDAILGLAQSRVPANGRRYVAVRNVSDPQIKAEGSHADQAHEAAAIYKA